MHTLGIDFGSDMIGLAVLDRRSYTVLEMIELELRDDIKDRMEERRALRRLRRQRKRHRRPVEPRREGGRLAGPPYRGAGGQNRRSLMQCKHIVPETGEMCGRNAPLKKNIRRELLAMTLRDVNIPEDRKKDFLSAFDGKSKPRRKPSETLSLLRELQVPARKIREVEILLHGALPGRSDYCREHLHAYGGDWTAERHAMILSNSVLAKHDGLISLLKKLAKKYNIDRVRIEDSNFDPELIRSGRLLEPGGGPEAPAFLKKNTFKALQYEYFNCCCYCGKEGGNARLEIDHVIPKSLGGADTWENLALACGECNSIKGWRTPEAAAMNFHVLEGVMVAGVPHRVSLEPVPFKNSRAGRYISRTNLGKLALRSRIREIFPEAAFEFDFGYRTSYRRNRWNWEKSRCHDAAAIAAMGNETAGNNPPDMPADKLTVRLKSGGGKLFDTFPVSKKNGGYVQNRTLISRDGRIARFTWGEIKRVTSPEKRRILEKLRRQAPPDEAGDADQIPDDLMETLPFRRVTLTRKDAGDAAVRKIGCNYFRADQPNWGTAVYLDRNGKKNSYIIKNGKVFGRTEPPPDFAKLLYVIRKGDLVRFTYKNQTRTEKVYANFSNGNLKLLSAEGELIMKSAKACVPAGRDGI